MSSKCSSCIHGLRKTFLISTKVCNICMITVIKNEENIELSNHEGNILSNRWTIDCKYYTADTNLCTSTSLNELSGQFVESINAIIILFDIEKVKIYTIFFVILFIDYKVKILLLLL